ncbi:MAG: hypothetical protein HYX48_05760 [Chlamydiales bacterium]|nr:hypothetical protein [Chlamydiales bacterium]
MRSKLLFRIFKLLLAVGAVIGIERFCHKQTRGFSLPNIYSDSIEYAASSSDEREIAPLLSQPFTFLDSGLECYAFLSEDRKLVLKLFKHQHIRQADLIAKLIPLPYFIKLTQMKQERLLSTFSSCKLAYEEMREETGLLFLHLNRTEGSLPVVTLIDKLGIRHEVALNEVHFILQKKADLLIPALSNDLKKEGSSSAKRRIAALFELIRVRCQKGIADRDPTLCKNYGFLDDRAIVIDVGSFSKNAFLQNPQIYKRELFYETLPLRCLLSREFPELLPYFNEEFEKAISGF